jgi:3-oxoacyl-[acyl-carrier protein] reductase
VVNYSSSREAAERVVAEIRQSGGEGIAVHADITKRTEIEALFHGIMETFGRLDVLVNNAGVLEFRPLEEIDEDHFRRVYDLHVLGLLLCTQQAVKHMRNGASIVNVGSVSTKDRHPNHLFTVAARRPST